MLTANILIDNGNNEDYDEDDDNIIVVDHLDIFCAFSQFYANDFKYQCC